MGAALLLRANGASAALNQSSLSKAATAGSLAAQGPANPGGQTNSARASAEAIEKRLAEARASLAAVAALDDPRLTNTPPGVTARDISMRRGLLQRLVNVYEQQASQTMELEAARQSRAELAREAQAWTAFAEPQPYSILLPDRLREEIQMERLKAANAETNLAMLDQLLEDNRGSLTTAEEQIRQLNERLEGTRDAAAASRLSWQRDLETTRSQVAAATVTGLDTERRIRQERLAASRTRLSLLQRQLVAADAGTKFTQADLDKVVARLETGRRELERELAEAEPRQRATLQALEAAREELRQTQAQQGPGSAAAARAAELLELRRAQSETAAAAVHAIRVLSDAANVERTMWEQRFAATDTRSLESLQISRRRLETLTRRVDLWKDFYRLQLDVSSSQAALQEARVGSLDPTSELLPAARERLAALRERDQWLLRIFRGVERLERLGDRWEAELQDAAGRLPFTDRVRSLFSNAQSFFQRLWTFELFLAEDTITVDGQRITGRRPVTVGKVLLAIFILVAGYWISGLISRVVEPVIIRRLRIEANQAGLIRRWLRALLVACLVVFSLVSVKIPLTIFAFAGGALAIGLGFGTQTILKNFVSGIIILFERPFRVGDVLDVAGQKGTITSIGLRASILQQWDGTETLIPNSALLENNLTNWTYTTRSVRFSVAVGAAYGSDPRQVTQLLHEVADRHGLVEKMPKPQVLFTDFGDSALNFELRFWVDVVKNNSAQIASDLRQMIVGAFGEHGIAIPFPQRDLHLDTARPLRVQVVPTSDSPTPALAESRPDKV